MIINLRGNFGLDTRSSHYPFKPCSRPYYIPYSIPLSIPNHSKIVTYGIYVISNIFYLKNYFLFMMLIKKIFKPIMILNAYHVINQEEPHSSSCPNSSKFFSYFYRIRQLIELDLSCFFFSCRSLLLRTCNFRMAPLGILS